MMSTASLSGFGYGDDSAEPYSDEPAEDGQTRRFTIHAIEVDVVYNAFGLHQPNAAIYVLEENLVEALAASGVTPDDAFADLPDHAREDLSPAVRNRLDDDRTEDGDGITDEKQRQLDEAEEGIEKAKNQKEQADDAKERKKARKRLHRARKKKAKLKQKAGDVDTKVLQPLTIRANVGDIVEIEFVNHLDRHASIHQTALPYHVQESDGMNVGFNPDTTVAPGESITYRWFATHEGTHFFHDGANPAFDSADAPPEEAYLTARGLFGSMVVEPEGATWTDPETGEELRSGVRADIRDPEGESHREFILHYHTPEGIVTADGERLERPGELPTEEEIGGEPGEGQEVHAINYRADPISSRLDEDVIDQLADSGLDREDLEEFFYNSWLFGDPGGGDNVYRTYLGDPVKMVAVGASHEERHVHHPHGHRWKEIDGREDVDTIDAQTVGMGATHEARFTTAHGGVGFFDVRPIGFGPGEIPDRLADGLDLVEDGLNFDGEAIPDDFDDGIADPLMSARPGMDWEEAFEVGAGGAHRSAGDYLFHCHLFPHYGEGMWGSVRVYDKEQDDLQPLPNNEPPIAADDETPGFPDFIPGEQGQVPPKPPYEFIRDPTPEEAAALGDIIPGAPYTDPCDPEVGTEEFGGPPAGEDAPVREYDIFAVPAEIVYNDAGDHDPEGQVFVLEEDLEDVLTGRMNPEPLVIRANVGDCVDIRLTNLMPEGRSNHIHFVSYDVLGSDSLSNGFNYDQTAEPGGTMTYRWFADEEGTIFFHDHIRGIAEVMHGHFAALIVEPEGSEWLDPHTGEPIEAGTQAIISPPDDEAFREFALTYQDFAPLRNRQGEFVNELVQHNVNAGVMAINYRNAPYYRRGPDPDPAYVHSSFVHGDPPTPVLEAYDGDPIRIRLFMGAYEEQHNFHVNGIRMTPGGANPEDTISQTVGTSEAFTFFLDAEADDLPNPDGLPVYDHLYGSGTVDDLWDGMWGIHRVFDAAVDHLRPLPDREPPEESISEERLREMGHPAPFLDWEELGRKAWLTYDEAVLREHVDDWERKRDRIREFLEALRKREEKLEERARERTRDEPKRTDGVAAEDDALSTIIEDGKLRKIRKKLVREGLARVDKPPFPPDRPARQNKFIDGNPPPLAPDPGDPCPDDATVREYDVTVFRMDIEFNEYTDHDPHGIVFALDEHVEEIREGIRPPEPLVIRANEGDCIQINLTNELPEDFAPEHAHPEMRTREQDLDIEWEESNRASLNPQRVVYDVQGSDGATVGFNFDQTIPPGGTITYRWFADELLNTSVVWDFADVRGHRHHGAYGRLIIEEAGSTWLDPRTAEPMADKKDKFATTTTTDGMIRTAEGPDFREFPLSISDGRFIINREDPDDCVVPPNPDDPEQDPDAPCNQLGDPEDQGYMAINNRAEPFIRRFQTGLDEPHLVFDSDTHGDPATPVLNAFLDDPVRFRVAQTADKQRGLDFHLAGHQWLRHRTAPETEIIGVDDRFSPGKAFHFDVLGGAGGLVDSVGDHIYMEMKARRRLESGAWGIFRVGETDDDFADPVQPLPEKAKEKRLRPKDRRGWTVVKGDATDNGHDDLLIGVPDSDVAGVDAGCAYLFYGPVDEREITDLSGADVQFLGERAGDRAGTTVSVDDGMVAIDTTHGTRYVVFMDELHSGAFWLEEADQKIDLAT